ncbi:MAG: DNA primase DnaG [Candidatus Baldrarchaeia archaeon]
MSSNLSREIPGGDTMNKENFETTKYVIRARFEVDGVVEKSDVIGAIFGQTEGLLGEDLDLRELQRTGRIGRIKVELETKGGKTSGVIIMPSCLDRVETAILAAALETIDRVGPCTARVSLEKIEDVREEKRKKIVQRAVEILKNWESSLPETKEIIEQVLDAIRSAELIKYGPDELPAGPGIEESDTIIIVEGRADVINLLKHGFKNVIAVEGTNIPKTIIDLCKRKTAIVFVDGDRGGELILKELLQVADIDYVARAPPGREVEELTRKEIIKALRNKIPVEQYMPEKQRIKKMQKVIRESITRPQVPGQILELIDKVKDLGKALILDENFNILAEVAVGQLLEELGRVERAKAIVFDGIITQRLVDLAYEKGVEYIIGAVKRDLTKQPAEMSILTFDTLE